MSNQAQKILLVFIQSNWMYVKHVEYIKACNFLNNGLICNPLALLELSYSPLFTQYISFILMLNMSNQAQKILLVFIQSNWMYVKHVEYIKACNFLNNGPICNPLALLELSYSPLFTQYISFILMSNMLNQAQKILLVFIQSNWMYVEHVEHIKACNFLNNGPICNLLALLELSYSPLFTQYISFILLSNMLNQAQKILLVFLQSNWMYVKHVEHISLYSTVHKTSINNMIPNMKFLNKEILWFNPSIYKVFRIKLGKNSNYNYFELN